MDCSYCRIDHDVVALVAILHIRDVFRRINNAASAQRVYVIFLGADEIQPVTQLRTVSPQDSVFVRG